MNEIFHKIYELFAFSMLLIVMFSPIILIAGLIFLMKWLRKKKAEEDLSTILNLKDEPCVKCGSTSNVKPRAYLVCYSFIIVTSKSPTRFKPICENCKVIAGQPYTFLTILLGWWGIPWGPIYTAQAIDQNNKGGIVFTKDDLHNF